MSLLGPPEPRCSRRLTRFVALIATIAALVAGTAATAAAQEDGDDEEVTTQEDGDDEEVTTQEADDEDVATQEAEETDEPTPEADETIEEAAQRALEEADEEEPEEADEQQEPPAEEQETAVDETDDQPETRISLQPGQGLRIEGADDEYSLNIRGYYQLHYEYEADDDGPLHSSFFNRLLRTDIQGHALTEDLTFRLMPEFARQGFLLDGWASYRFDEGFQLRAGQFNIPFNWERHLPPLRQQFSDRSVANNEFQWPGGRDIGLMAHGDPVDELRYGIGIFSGQGMNTRRSDSAGHVVSGRAIFTPVGDYQTNEVPVEPAEQLTLSVAAGAMYAHDNNARDWAAWHDEQPAQADVISTTADAHLIVDRVSAHVSGFYRDVIPGEIAGTEQLPEQARPDPIERFDGFGVTAHTGVVVLPERLTAVARYSQARPNFEVDDARQREALAGGHIFHRGLDSRFQFEGGLQSVHDGEDWNRGLRLNANYQLIF